MNARHRVALGTVGVAIATTIGVIVSSQVLLDEAVSTTVENAAVSGVVAAAVFVVAELVRRRYS